MENKQRSTIVYIALTLAVLIIELAATYGSLTGEPLNPVENWTVTRSTDWLAFAAVAGGCVALYWRRTRPLLVLIVSTLSYCAFILRDYELGLFLPVMLMLYFFIAQGHSRMWAIGSAAASLAVSLFWVSERAAHLDSGVAMLAWVAFGTVYGVFFIVPMLIGEIARLKYKEYSNLPATYK